MNRKTITVILLSIFLVISFNIIPYKVVTAQPEGIDVYVDDDADPGWYDATHVETIQEGIDNASTGDTVYVYNGTYIDDVVGLSGTHMNVYVNKSVNLIGENKNTTIMDGNSTTHILHICRSNVTVSGFTIKNAQDGVIFLANDDERNLTNSSISDCIVSDITGSPAIGLSDTTGGILTVSNVTIENCSIIDPGAGSWRAIVLVTSSSDIYMHHNRIINNYIESKDNGITIFGSSSGRTHNNTVSGNVIDGQTTGWYAGIRIQTSEYNIISGNTINNEADGAILCTGGENNTITGNNITNVGTSIFCNSTSNNNIIFQNNIFNETNAIDNGTGNAWYNGTIGNYWDDYDTPCEGAWDNNSDGIADAPYDIAGTANAQDQYPLMDPYGPFYPWDLNKDNNINNLDVTIISANYVTSGPLGCPYGWIRSDINDNGVVNYLDASLLTMHYGEDYR